MPVAVKKTINWDSILETYGPDAKMSLTKLLSEARLDDTEPAAIVIAAMFIAQIDSNRSFRSITATIDDGKTQFSEQFQQQIHQLKGIISEAKDQLVETNKKEIEKRNAEIFDVIKLGLAKAIGREGEKQHKRATFLNSTTMVCISALTLASLLVGAVGAYVLMSGARQPIPVTSKDLDAVDNGALWLQIVTSNQDTLTTCLANAEQLNQRCVMTLP